uniref:Uncharacterized protein n=1 Tax=Avena sativa TaxID=4498 RepID=A0ACD6AHX4_AVESA
MPRPARCPSSPSPQTPSTALSLSPPPGPSNARSKCAPTNLLPTKPPPFFHLRRARDISVSAFHCSQVIPGMVERGRGTIIFTGSSASVTGFAGYSDLSCGKFALRGLSQFLAKEFQPAGVHVAHMIIDGVIGERRSQRGKTGAADTAGAGAGADPDAVAQSYCHVHAQDKSAWTLEMDIRSPSFM